MLRFIRDRAKGFIAWLIFILIVIPFAFWGINSYFEGGGDVYVAKVNGEEIPARTYQRLLVQERAFRQQLLGENAADSPLLDDTLIKRNVIERLVNSALLTQTAREAGFRIGDELLRARILSEPQFQRDGRFDGQLYRRILNSMGLTEPAYEAELRRDMLVAQLMNGVSETTFVPEPALEQLLRLQYQQRRLAYFLVAAAALTTEEPIDEAAVEAYYQENQSRFAIPEQVRVAYLELAAADLLDEVEVDEETLRRLYEERRADFMVEEERRARHILVAVPEDAGEDADRAAREKAQEILQRLQSGESFEELAKTLSDDPASAKDGGDLGYFGRGVMPKPFEERVFTMQVGEISEPVRTRFGYHVIELTDIRPAHGRSFEEVRDVLEREYREQRAEDLFYDLADRLTDLTYESPDTLDVAARELGLEIQVSDYFSRDAGTGIAADPKVREAAFNPDVLEAGNNSEPITIGDNHLVVLRVEDRKPVSHRPLEEVRADIEQILRLERARERAEEIGEQARARLQEAAAAGQAPTAELLAELTGQWAEPGWVDRRAQGVPPDVLRLAFSVPRPQEGASIAGRRLSSGDYAVVVVSEVRDGDLAQIPGSERQALRQQLLRRVGMEESEAVLESLKAQAEIEIRQEQL